MLIRYLIAFYLFFAVVFSAPLLNNDPEETSDLIILSPSEDNASLPIITLPDVSEDTINYETLGGGVEGDMIFPKGFDPRNPSKVKGAAATGPARWPNNVIPYDTSAITSSSDRNLILNSIQTLMYAVATRVAGQTWRRKCVNFRPRLSSDESFVTIRYGDGCSSSVGYSKGQHVLTLASGGCFRTGIIQHELMHVLGFSHEQSRPDRDSYITVNYGNIQSGMEYNFGKYQWGNQILTPDTPYDYGSVMHYDAYAFSRNAQPTIVPKRQGVTLGQRKGLSATDIAEIRKYYGC